jgi:hypothetical protein
MDDHVSDEEPADEISASGGPVGTSGTYVKFKGHLSKKSELLCNRTNALTTRRIVVHHGHMRHTRRILIILPRNRSHNYSER